MATFITLPDEMKLKILRTAIAESGFCKYFTATGDHTHLLVETGAKASYSVRTILSLCRVSKELKCLTTEAAGQHLRTVLSVTVCSISFNISARTELNHAEAALLLRAMVGTAMLAAKLKGQPGMFAAVWLDLDTFSWFFWRHFYKRTGSFNRFCRCSAPADAQRCLDAMRGFSELNAMQANLHKEALVLVKAVPELAERAPLEGLGALKGPSLGMFKRVESPCDSEEAKISKWFVEAFVEDDNLFNSEIARKAVQANLLIAKGKTGNPRQMVKALNVMGIISLDDDSDENIDRLFAAHAPAALALSQEHGAETVEADEGTASGNGNVGE